MSATTCPIVSGVGWWSFPALPYSTLHYRFTKILGPHHRTRVSAARGTPCSVSSMRNYPTKTDYGQLVVGPSPCPLTNNKLHSISCVAATSKLVFA
jgi:hypothetical protein